MIEKLSKMIAESSAIVFFGGAGVSTESGIPDFRSVDGLYHQTYKYPPEVMLSSEFFWENTEEFYQFYKDKLICTHASPNFAHHYLAKLEKQGKLRGIVTQNIDNLHNLAGSKQVFELHGSTQRNYCTKCNKFFDLAQFLSMPDYHCPCGGIIKPDVVLYGEGLPEKTVQSAISAISQADMLLVAGTSLAVYPAASFVDYFQGKYLAVINKSPLQLSCDLVIEGPVGETLHKVDEILGKSR